MNRTYPQAANSDLKATADGEADASAISVPQRWMQEQASARKLEPMVNPNQLTSLSAMIAYAANRSGQSEYRIERGLADSFRIPNAKFLAANDFDAAIRYLADILPL